MLKELKELKKRLQNYRMKLTPQRLAVFRVLSNSKSHPDAETIFTEIKKTLPSVSLGTVYSVLKSLQKIGFVQEVCTFGDSRRFDGNVTIHPHLICICCGRIEDLQTFTKKDINDLERLVTKKSNYKIVKSCLSFYGYCSDCKKKNR